ncbi:GSCFA domain-containing protein [Pseudoroseicyclus tamaricis]|nr:GSCFA domain-containing protein [Pseudoroseicyclus tamaricis]
MLTVSPVPMVRSFTGQDVLEANSYSKSLLRVAAEMARERLAFVDYFPSYESVTLTDRSRAYGPDRIHPTAEIVELNVGRMLAAYRQGPADCAAAPDRVGAAPKN